MRAPSRDQVLRALPEADAPLVHAVVAAAEARELSVLLVGGPVRDLLLGRALRDVDLIVEARAGEGAEALARAAAPDGARVVPHGRFGTVRLSAGDATLDLATVRRESYARPGALPTVEPGTLQDDLERRDFTLNALAIPLTAAARAGRPALIDPGSARDDLAAGVLRVFHRRSFHDDPTRALRAARLVGRLGFRLARETRSALRGALRDGAFGGVSGDRFRRELEKLFDDPRLGLDPVKALRPLDDWHVLGALEPGLSLPRPALATLRRLGRAVAEPPWPPGRLSPWVAGLALWLAELEAPLRRRTLRRLNVRGAVAQRLVGFPKQRDGWLRGLARARGRGAIDRLLSEIDDESLLALYASAELAGRRRIARWSIEDRPRRLPVTGADLTAEGLRGPAVGAALSRIRVAHLDGSVRTREEALALAREMARRAQRGRARQGSR